MFPDKGMLVLGSIKFHALLPLKTKPVLCCSHWLSMVMCAAFIDSTCQTVNYKPSPPCVTHMLPFVWRASLCAHQYTRLMSPHGLQGIIVFASM